MIETKTRSELLKNICAVGADARDSVRLRHRHRMGLVMNKRLQPARHDQQGHRAVAARASGRFSKIRSQRHQHLGLHHQRRRSARPAAGAAVQARRQHRRMPRGECRFVHGR
jgi:hypothetical protein